TSLRLPLDPADIQPTQLQRPQNFQTIFVFSHICSENRVSVIGIGMISLVFIIVLEESIKESPLSISPVTRIQWLLMNYLTISHTQFWIFHVMILNFLHCFLREPNSNP
ncbi:hypothetical protein C5167_013614, partial [Papaver somniferum]